MTPLAGIRNKLGTPAAINYVRGCKIRSKGRREFAKAADAAQKSDVVVMCLGTSPRYEGEENPLPSFGDDRLSLDLYPTQQALLEEVDKTRKPIILVLFSGGLFTINWADTHIPAIIQAWYPGEEGGTALTDILLGDYSPAARLPFSWIRSLDDIPEFTDYSMKGRTYRYCQKPPLYPFGFGLSYAEFRYSNLRLSRSDIPAGEDLELLVDVENVGNCDGDEVVQIYLKDLKATVQVPHHQLCGFRRVKLGKGEKKSVSFRITARQIALIDEEGRCILEPGGFSVYAGGSQPDARSMELTGTEVLCALFKVTGEVKELIY